MITIPADSRAPRSQPGESLRHQYFDVRETNPPVLFMTTISPKFRELAYFYYLLRRLRLFLAWGHLGLSI